MSASLPAVQETIAGDGGTIVTNIISHTRRIFERGERPASSIILVSTILMGRLVQLGCPKADLARLEDHIRTMGAG